MQHFINVIDKIDFDKSEIIIPGHLNIKYNNNIVSSHNNHIHQLCDLSSIDQLITTQTRKKASTSTIIDLILTLSDIYNYSSG